MMSDWSGAILEGIEGIDGEGAKYKDLGVVTLQGLIDYANTYTAVLKGHIDALQNVESESYGEFSIQAIKDMSLPTYQAAMAVIMPAIRKERERLGISAEYDTFDDSFLGGAMPTFIGSPMSSPGMVG